MTLTSTQYSSPGTVYLVGAGPGDPGLITVRGQQLLREAGAVVYDALANPALLDWAAPTAELIFAGKRAGSHAMRQEEINAVLRSKACAHAVVVRLKGGDPFVFGRGGEEMAYLRAAGIPVEVVPGISSAVAAAAAAGVPVTHRDLSSNFAVVAGHRSSDGTEPPWDALAALDTLVIMMGLQNIEHLTQRLLAAGRGPQTPAMIVCSATLPDQQVVVATLAELPALASTLDSAAPATIVIGAVVGLASSGKETAALWASTLAAREVGAEQGAWRWPGDSP